MSTGVAANSGEGFVVEVPVSASRGLNPGRGLQFRTALQPLIATKNCSCAIHRQWISFDRVGAIGAGNCSDALDLGRQPCTPGAGARLRRHRATAPSRPPSAGSTIPTGTGGAPCRPQPPASASTSSHPDRPQASMPPNRRRLDPDDRMPAPRRHPPRGLDHSRLDLLPRPRPSRPAEGLDQLAPAPRVERASPWPAASTASPGARKPHPLGKRLDGLPRPRRTCAACEPWPDAGTPHRTASTVSPADGTRRPRRLDRPPGRVRRPTARTSTRPQGGGGGGPAPTGPPLCRVGTHASPNFRASGGQNSPLPVSCRATAIRPKPDRAHPRFPRVREPPAFRPFTPCTCPASPPPRTRLAGQRPPERGRRGPESGRRAGAHTRQR